MFQPKKRRKILALHAASLVFEFFTRHPFPPFFYPFFSFFVGNARCVLPPPLIRRECEHRLHHLLLFLEQPPTPRASDPPPFPATKNTTQEKATFCVAKRVESESRKNNLPLLNREWLRGYLAPKRLWK